MTKKIFCLLVVKVCRFLWNFEGLIWLLGVVIISQTLAIALGASADGVLIPTVMVKAIPVFRYFDYGHSAEFVQGKKKDRSSSCIIVVYPRDK